MSTTLEILLVSFGELSTLKIEIGHEIIQVFNLLEQMKPQFIKLFIALLSKRTFTE